MSELDRLLKSHQPPLMPAGLAQRAVTEAVKHPQEKAAAPAILPRRRDRRGGWKRPLWISAASLGLAFTSAVAASVVSGGRIEIPVMHPVVQEVVDAVPVLHQAQVRRSPERLAAADLAKAEPAPAVAEPPPEHEVAAGQPGLARTRVGQKLAIAKQRVEERRAAGLPTPRADRIQNKAKQIVERRQAAGLPTPPVEQVEGGLALREIRQMRQQRLGQPIDPSAISDEQLVRFAQRLPPDKRGRFEALSPEMQRRLVARSAERIRARRAVRQAAPEPTP